MKRSFTSLRRIAILSTGSPSMNSVRGSLLFPAFLFLLLFSGPQAFGQSTVTKQLYLSDATQELDRILPTAGTALSSVDLSFDMTEPGKVYAFAGNSKTFMAYDITGDSWDDGSYQDVSDNVNDGGALVNSGDFMYGTRGLAGKGGGDDFWRYSKSGNSWSDMTNSPEDFDAGGSLVLAGGKIYAFAGNSKKFMAYDIAGDSWDDGSYQDVSDNVKAGGGLVYDGGDYIYGTRGDDQKHFWRYSISGNSWSDMTDSPEKFNVGGSLVLVGGKIYAFAGNSKKFMAYDIAGDSWNDGSYQDVSDNVKAGGGLVYDGGDYIYGTRGDDQKHFWRYSISGNSWSDMTDSPEKFNVGGSLVFTQQSLGVPSTSFTQNPVMCSPLTIKSGLTISVTNYVSIVAGTMSANPNITAELKYGATNIITLSNPTYSGGLLTWTGTLGSDVTVPAGQAIELEITTAQTGVAFTIEYDSGSKPSKIDLPVTTFIDIISYDVYDATYPGGSIITGASAGTTVYPRAVVTDPFGFSDITAMNITISPTVGTVAATSVATSGCTRTYEYAWNTTGLGGTYSLPATAKEGFEDTVVAVEGLNFDICSPLIGTPVFTLTATSTRCQGAGSVTYTATSTNSTGMTYSLDAASLAGGNTINSSTGQVTYVAGWSGTSTITASASGCGGPVTSDHTATITPTVGTPVFTSGATSTRCQGAATISYAANATNTTGITYSLDATSLAAGNTINSSNGDVTYTAGWSGDAVITASAAGCNGPAISTHTATSETLPSASVAGPDQTQCNTSNFTMAATAPAVGTGAWTIVSGSATITTPSSATTTVTAVAAGTSVTLRWTVSNVCADNTDDVTIQNDIQTIANAGPNQTLCNTSTFTMAANSPVAGSGAWSIVSGSATITTPASPTSTITAVTAGTSVTLRWTTSNGVCVDATDNITIQNNELPSAAVAGPDQTLCDSSSFTMAATAPVIGTGSWTIVSGSATITTSWSPTSTVTGVAPDASVTLRWTVSNNGCGDNSDDITISNNAAPSTNGAGPNQRLCTTSTFIMAATAPVVGTAVWSIVSGGGTITTPASPTTTVTGVPIGTSTTLRWTVSSGICSDYTDDVTVTYATICAPTAFNDNVQASDIVTTNLDVLANDIDPQGQSLTASIAMQPANGTVSVLGDNTIDYDANAGFSGIDIFTYAVCNTSGLCDTATVFVDVYKTTTFAAGAYIIDMGVVPQTVGNALKPYGLIYEVTTEHYAPVEWIINPNKDKDGVDFTYDDADSSGRAIREFKGGPFLIRAGFFDSTLTAVVSDWESQGVVGIYTTSEITVPVAKTISYFMGWTLDAQNGHIAEDYIINAGIPSTSYSWQEPWELGGCDDVFVMPHADPTWAVHGHLLEWNASYENGGSQGTLWAACHAVSALENLFDPANPSDQMNFLSVKTEEATGNDDYADNSLILWDDHDDGSLPYSYSSHSAPEMQFMGAMDNGTDNGSEQIFIPHLQWRPETTVSVWDPDNAEASSNQVAAIAAYGYAFADTTRGQVMYLAGHDHDKGNSDDIAIQRSFFNFSYSAAVGKSIKVKHDISVDSVLLQMDETSITVSAFGGENVNYTYQWLSSCDGFFTQPNAITTEFIPYDEGNCVITCLVTDECGRAAFASVPYDVQPSSCTLENGNNQISGEIYLDDNNDLFYNYWEDPLNDMTVELFLDENLDGILNGTEGDVVIATTTTTSGAFEFELAPPASSSGSYLELIKAGNDDASEAGSGAVDIASSTLTLSSAQPYTGLRFQDLDIPRGAKILTTSIIFTASESRSANSDFELSGVGIDDAVPFSTTNGDVSDKWNFSNRAPWNNVEAWVKNQEHSSPDISSMIQIIVNRTGWSTGNDLAILLNAGSGERLAYSYDGFRNKAPKLSITWESNGYPVSYIVQIDLSDLPYGAELTTDSVNSTIYHLPNQAECVQKYGVKVNRTIAINDVNVTLQMTSVTGSVIRNDFDPELDNIQFGGYMKQSGIGLLTSGATLSGTNSEGDPVANAGTFTFDADGEYEFVPEASFIGEVVLNYFMCDDALIAFCDTACLTLVTSSFPNPSVASTNSVVPVDDYYVTYGTPIEANILINDDDPELDGLALQVFGERNGELDWPFDTNVPVGGLDQFQTPFTNAGTFKLLANGSYSFTPEAGFVGTLEIEYNICDDYDAAAACDNALLTIEVLPRKDPTENDAPFAGDDYANTIINTPKTGQWITNDGDDDADDITLNDLPGSIDPENPGAGVLMATYTTNQGGDLKMYDDGTFEYTPVTDYFGPDQLAYRICDVSASPVCDSATIYLLVSPVYYDFGDLPAQYPTATNLIPIDFNKDGTPDMPSSIWFGANLDAELATQVGNGIAEGDNNGDINDEDGLLFNGYSEHQWLDRDTADFKVIINGTDPGMTVYYGMWLDWDFDGVFDDFFNGSWITQDNNLRMNQDTLVIDVPVWGHATGSNAVGVRLRAFQSLPNSTQFGGISRAGEVEDYIWFLHTFLPVELTSFDVAADGNNALLSWQTASEVNNDYFSVERSTNASDWEQVGVVQGHGNSNEIHNYEFTDAGLSNGLYYYRLQQFDFDGTFEYTEIRSVTINSDGTNANHREINVFPTPASNMGQLNIEGLLNGEVEVKMYALDGSQSVTITVGDEHSIDLSHYGLNTGMYIMDIHEGDEIFSKKVMLFE